MDWNTYKWVNNLIVVVFILSLCTIFSPFFFLTFFNHPAADDFCLAVSFRDSGLDNLFDVVLDYYQNWNSRYFSIALIGAFSNSFGLIEGYKFAPTLLFIGWLISSCGFLKSIFDGVRLFTVATGALAFCIFYILTMPNVSTGFYWLTSAFIYQTGNIMAMGALACMIRLGTTKYPYRYALAAAFLIFASIGSTELYIPFMTILVTVRTAYVVLTRSDRADVWIFLLVVTLVSAVLLGVAPGNEARGQHFVARHQFWFSLAASAYHAVMWFLQWIWEPLLWLTTLLYSLWLPTVSQKSHFLQRIRIVHLAMVLPCWLLILLACFFAGFWAMGDTLPDRALNVVYLIFLIGWFALITVLISNICNSRVISSSTPRTRTISWLLGIVATIAMTIGMLNTHSFRTAYADLFERAPRFNNILQARYLVISQARAKDKDLIVRVPQINAADRPSTIFFMDIRDQWSSFPNPCYAEFFGIKGIETEK